MKKLKLTCGLLLIGVATSQLQSCAVAAVGASIAAVKWANAKKIEAKQECAANYNVYVKSVKNPISMAAYCSAAGFATSDGKDLKK